jgi:hypothetical protein
MISKKAIISILIGLLLIGYNMFKIFYGISKHLVDLKDKDIFFKSGYVVGSYGLSIIGVIIILFALLSKRKQTVL